MNTIGTRFRVTIFGASHDNCIGCVIDGIPAGISLDLDYIQKEVDLRKPVAMIGTPRKEPDIVNIMAGLKDETTTGTPLVIQINNTNTDSSKYEKFKVTPRPGHADFPAVEKYGVCHDLRGGGQFSGRMTAPLTAAGAIAKEILLELGVKIVAYTQSIGGIQDLAEHSFKEIKRESRENPVHAADPTLALDMLNEILAAREDGDSVGGVIRCLTEGLPVGVGEPFFDTLEGEIAKMIFAIPGVRGIEFGKGFAAAAMRGSEHNDPYTIVDDYYVKTETNNAGGVLGGLSTGMPLDFKVAFKPTASIFKEQQSVNLGTMTEEMLLIKGRHDPCIVPRAVIPVEAATAIVLTDLCLRGDFIA